MFELARHCTSTKVTGALGKLIKHFQREHNKTVYTFCDDSFFSGISYKAAGFKEVSKIIIDYKYVVNNKREHKFTWRLKDIKAKLGITGLSEKDAMKQANIYRIWDCGKTRFEIQGKTL